MRQRVIIALGAFLLLGMQSSYLQTYTTSFFRIKHEKSIPSTEVSAFGKMLETSYSKYKKVFAVTPSGRVDVMYYSSPQLIKRESRIPVFDDGVFAGGKIYVATGYPLEGAKMQGMASRVAARCVLNQIKSCPLWLAECYSLHAGNELWRFGAPVRPSMLSFADLAEDYSRAESADEFREVYAKLGATASFFIDRYGETKFQNVFTQLKSGRMFEEALEGAFGEKIDVIEKAWAKALVNPPK